mgnify:CR=1 FL=1
MNSLPDIQKEYMDLTDNRKETRETISAAAPMNHFSRPTDLSHHAALCSFLFENVTYGGSQQ